MKVPTLRHAIVAPMGARRVAVIVGLIICGVSPAWAQAPAAPACEDQLRASRVLADVLSTSRARDDQEAAQAIATLLKRIDLLSAQLAEATAPKPAAPKDGK